MYVFYTHIFIGIYAYIYTNLIWSSFAIEGKLYSLLYWKVCTVLKKSKEKKSLVTEWILGLCCMSLETSPSFVLYLFSVQPWSFFHFARSLNTTYLSIGYVLVYVFHISVFLPLYKERQRSTSDILLVINCFFFLEIVRF